MHTPALDVLLIERADFAGFWQSVTGSQEDGETFAQTAVREAFEETGFDATKFGGMRDLSYENVYQIYPRWAHRYPGGTTHNREHCFALCLPEKFAPTLAPREHVAFEWMPADVAALRVTSWSNAAVLQNLRALLTGARSASESIK